MIEIQALAPGAKSYATWNASDKDSSISLAGGNLSASRTTTSGFGVVRANQAVSAGQVYWETQHTFSAGTGFVLAAGIAQASANLASQIGVGVGGLSVGGPGQDGQCQYKNVITADAGTVVSGNTVRHWLDMDAGTYSVAIQNGAWFVAASGLTGTWYPAACLTNTGQTILANFGASAFTYAVPSSARAGLYTTGASTASTIYVASDRVVTSAFATPASTYYAARLLPSADPSMAREGNAWPIGGADNSAGIGELEFANHDGALDYWRDLIVRDRPITIRYGTPTQALSPSTCTLWAATRCESIEVRPRSIVLKLTDLIGLLDKAGQTALYDSTVAIATLVDQPRPTLIGSALVVDPVQTNGATYLYDVATDAAAIVEITDRGDPFDVGPTEFDRTANGFDLLAAPVGKVAASAVGCTTTVVANVLTENFTAWTASAVDPNPTGWTVGNENGSTTHVYESPTGVCRIAKDTTYTSTLYLERDLSLVAGKVYRVTINCSAFVSGHVRVFTATSGGVLSIELYRLQSTGVKTFYMVGLAGYTRLRLEARYSTVTDLSIDYIYVDEMQVLERLPDIVTDLCVTRGGLSAGDIDSAAFAALDAKAPYKNGFYSRTQWNIRQVLQQLMDGYGGSVLQDRTGKISCWRLEPPADTAVLSLGPEDLIDDWTCELDTAPGLTTRIGTGRHWTLHGDADFATSVTPDVRERLKAIYEAIRKALGSVDAVYTHADKAPALDTLLQLGTYGLAEISRLVTYYSQPRYVYRGSALLDQTTVLALKIGETVNVRQPRLGLSAGKNLIVRRVQSRGFSQRVALEVRG